MVFMDFGDDFGDSALNGYFTFPTVFGHEVVADVVEVGPAVTTLEVGQRVVLNPWLSCGPRGIDPPCPSCQDGDYSLCWHFTQGPIAAGHPHRHVEGRTRRLRRLPAGARVDAHPRARRA